MWEIPDGIIAPSVATEFSIHRGGKIKVTMPSRSPLTRIKRLCAMI